jgi:type I restriction enzyme R subunit
MAETPEQKARREIDADLTSAGWIVQERDDLNLKAGRGTAVRVDRKAAGAIRAKPTGTPTGVEAQSAKYAAGLQCN